MIAEVGDKSTRKAALHPFTVGCVLLGVAAIPDAMVVPVMHDLCVTRFGITEGAAHAFMVVNLLGAVLAVGILALLNRRIPTSKLLLIAAGSSSLLMAGMAIAPSWWVFLSLRCIEGGADLLLLSIPFRMIASCGKGERYGGRMGAAFTVMFLALALGAGIGTVIGQDHATNVLWASAVSCGVLFLIVAFVQTTVDITSVSPRPDAGKCPLIPSEWIGAIFLALDRGLSALVSVTLPLLIVSGFEVSKWTLGVGIGGMFIALALFSPAAGILADRVGGLRIRAIAACVSGVGLIGLGLMNVVPPVVILAPSLMLYGVGAAGLMPSAFSSCVRPEASTLVFSSLQAAGQCGYAMGIVAGGILISIYAVPAQTMLTILFPIAGVVFICINLLLISLLRLTRKTVR